MSDERVHPDAVAFGGASDAYERGRPGYADEAVRWLAGRLGLRAGRTALDLAAGTGKLTRQLLATGAHVVAVEPSAGMRAHLPPQAEVLDGVAERIPLTAASVDAVAVGSAFHWFDAPAALREIHRVLRPGGGLAVVGNARDESDAVAAAARAVVEPLVGGRSRSTPHRYDRDIRAALEASGLFGEVEEARFEHRQELDADGLAARFLSISFVAGAPEERRREVERALRALAAEHGEPVVLRYVTHVHTAFRLGDGDG